jgi:hypothetical protein
VKDWRTKDLAASVAAIRSARQLAGELNGPMHPAQLSDPASFICGNSQWRLDNCDRRNVFHVPTYVVASDSETHRPKAEDVGQKILEALADLWQRANSASPAVCTAPR